MRLVLLRMRLFEVEVEVEPLWRLEWYEEVVVSGQGKSSVVDARCTISTCLSPPPPLTARSDIEPSIDLGADHPSMKHEVVIWFSYGAHN